MSQHSLDALSCDVTAVIWQYLDWKDFTRLRLVSRHMQAVVLPQVYKPILETLPLGEKYALQLARLSAQDLTPCVKGLSLSHKDSIWLSIDCVHQGFKSCRDGLAACTYAKWAIEEGHFDPYGPLDLCVFESMTLLGKKLCCLRLPKQYFIDMAFDRHLRYGVRDIVQTVCAVFPSENAVEDLQILRPCSFFGNLLDELCVRLKVKRLLGYRLLSWGHGSASSETASSQPEQLQLHTIELHDSAIDLGIFQYFLRSGRVRKLCISWVAGGIVQWNEVGHILRRYGGNLEVLKLQPNKHGAGKGSIGSLRSLSSLRSLGVPGDHMSAAYLPVGLEHLVLYVQSPETNQSLSTSAVQIASYRQSPERSYERPHVDRRWTGWECG